jgi:Tfp pilus assembly protein PilF
VLTLRGHTSPVFTAAFSPNQQRIVTSGADGYVHVWHPENGLELLSVGSGVAPIPWAAFTPNNRAIIAGYPSPIEIWESASPSQVAAWEKEDAEAAAEVEAMEHRNALATRAEYLCRHGQYQEAAALSAELLRSFRTEGGGIDALPPERCARLACMFLAFAEEFGAHGDVQSAAAHTSNAKQFLAPFVEQPVPTEPASFDGWLNSANVFIQAKQWRQAAILLQRLRGAQPKNVPVAIGLAAVLVEAGDATQYGEFRQQLLAEFSASEDLMALRVVPKLVCLQPLAARELDAAERMMQQCATNPQPAGALPWMQLSQGIVAMRRGEFTRSVEVLRSCLAAPRNQARQRAAHAVLALAFRGMGDMEQSRAAIVEAKKIVRNVASIESPRDWVIADIFLREAIVATSDERP